MSDYVPRPLAEIDYLSLDALTAADLAAVIRSGGTKSLSVETALRELTVRAVEQKRAVTRESEIGRIAIELFKRLKDA